MSPAEAWAVDTSYSVLPAASLMPSEVDHGDLCSLFTQDCLYLAVQSSSFPKCFQYFLINVPMEFIASRSLTPAEGGLNWSPRQHCDLSGVAACTRRLRNE